MRSYNEIELKVLMWAEARKIVPNSTSKAQATKALEEAGELLEAASVLHGMRLSGVTDGEAFDYWRLKFKDAAGDVMVCLVNACALEDVPLLECFEGAYNEIKDRKGTMNSNGVFVKES